MAREATNYQVPINSRFVLAALGLSIVDGVRPRSPGFHAAADAFRI